MNSLIRGYEKKLITDGTRTSFVQITLNVALYLVWLAMLPFSLRQFRFFNSTRINAPCLQISLRPCQVSCFYLFTSSYVSERLVSFGPNAKVLVICGNGLVEIVFQHCIFTLKGRLCCFSERDFSFLLSVSI